MQKPGKNHSGYHGETIDIRAVLRDIETAAQQHGWSSEVFRQTPEFNTLALHRQPLSTFNPQLSTRVYLSTGIHGDEPAGPLAVRQLLQENNWPANLALWICPCLNPVSFVLHRRESERGFDLNRQYLNPAAEETRAHIAWLQR